MIGRSDPGPPAGVSTRRDVTARCEEGRRRAGQDAKGVVFPRVQAEQADDSIWRWRKKDSGPTACGRVVCLSDGFDHGEQV